MVGISIVKALWSALLALAILDHALSLIAATFLLLQASGVEGMSLAEAFSAASAMAQQQACLLSTTNGDLITTLVLNVSCSK